MVNSWFMSLTSRFVRIFKSIYNYANTNSILARGWEYQEVGETAKLFTH